jgi:HD domain
MRLADIRQPRSAATAAALEAVAAYYSPSLANHCLRSYLWAAAYGQLTGLDFDAELLYVAALLHDIALVPEFDNQALPFEEAGGHVAWMFAAGARWPVQRRSRAAEVIVAHMRDEGDPHDDPEGHLLAVATGFDIAGHHARSWPAELQAEVIASFPRLALAGEFLRCFQDQASRKPRSAAAGSLRAGLAERLGANPLDRLG